MVWNIWQYKLQVGRKRCAVLAYCAAGTSAEPCLLVEAMGKSPVQEKKLSKSANTCRGGKLYRQCWSEAGRKLPAILGRF